MRRPAAQRWLGTSAFAAVMLLGACGIDDSAGPDQPAVGHGANQEARQEPSEEAGKIDAASSGRVLPIEAFMATPEEHLLLDQAHDLLVQDCMQRNGFEYDVPDRRLDRGYDPLLRRYGAINDHDTAAEYGYRTPFPIGADVVDHATRRLSEAGLEALTGGIGPAEERQGCWGEADRMLSPDSEVKADGGVANQHIVTEINFESYARAYEDERLQDHFSAWSRCMAQHGYDVSDPSDARKYTYFDTDSSSPTDAEIEMAIRDVQCQESTGVIDVWFEVESAIQTELIDANAELLALVRTENDEALRRAANVLAGLEVQVSD